MIWENPFFQPDCRSRWKQNFEEIFVWVHGNKQKTKSNLRGWLPWWFADANLIVIKIADNQLNIELISTMRSQTKYSIKNLYKRNIHTTFYLTTFAPHNIYSWCRHKMSKPDKNSTLVGNIFTDRQDPKCTGKTLRKNLYEIWFTIAANGRQFFLKVFLIFLIMFFLLSVCDNKQFLHLFYNNLKICCQ